MIIQQRQQMMQNQPIPQHLPLQNPIPPLRAPTQSLGQHPMTLAAPPALQQPSPPPPPPLPQSRPVQAKTTSAHPLNLCRQFEDPLVRPQPSKSEPPPLAHGAKWMPPRGSLIENGALNLCKQSASNNSLPAHVVAPVPAKPPPPPPPPALSHELVENRLDNCSRVDGSLEKERPPIAVVVQEKPRTPDLAGSPASPGDMVIDESADTRSSPASDQDERANK